MRVTSLKVLNFRSLADVGPIELGRMNVFVGPNNAGKSSILRAVSTTQAGIVPSLFPEVRLDAAVSTIEIGLTDISGIRPWAPAISVGVGTLTVEIRPDEQRSGGQFTMTLVAQDGSSYGVNPLPAREPDHFIVPYFSRRKAVGYVEDVREQYALQVSPQFDFLAAKLSRLGNFAFEAGERYRQTCQAVLGFVVTAVPSQNGQRPGVYLPDRHTLPLEQMGEGVPNIVGLLADLALSEGKLVLIEEPENDLHPRALKAVLELIVTSAQSNQFLVSTHSNIVTRHLGAVDDSRIYYVDAEPGMLPAAATVRLVEPTPEARLAVLRDLGYSLADFELWDGWLFLEESSAERIIRDYLVPWFAPKLTRLRTLSAGGNTEVEPTFQDFHRLIRFTHLEEAYRDAAWVRVDGDSDGNEIVERLRRQYPSWHASRFAIFSEPNFERYYPVAFAEQVEAALAASGVQARREAKRQLLEDVLVWLDEDAERGRAALAESAATVIADLQEIEAHLTG